MLRKMKKQVSDVSLDAKAYHRGFTDKEIAVRLHFYTIDGEHLITYLKKDEALLLMQRIAHALEE